jgi:hypothetical protein
MSEDRLLRETAYYYPEPYWLAREGAWIKSLLLFFDDIAILLPEYMRGRHIQADPSLAEPLEDHELLRVLEPEWFVDEPTARKATEVVTTLVDSGAFDSLPKDGGFAELSMSRMGYGIADELARKAHNSLFQRGLAAETQDGVSIPMHRTIRALYLVILAQLARETGSRHGLDLQPVTNVGSVTSAFTGFLELDPMPSKGQVVSFDLQVVTVDLTRIPLDEVLHFRDENRQAHRAYMQNLRAFASELSMLSIAERERAFNERRTELQEQAHDLHRRSWQAWRSPRAITGLGLTGAAWSIKTGNPIPAVLSTIGAGLGMLPSPADGNAYSYLFRASQDLQR